VFIARHRGRCTVVGNIERVAAGHDDRFYVSAVVRLLRRFPLRIRRFLLRIADIRREVGGVVLLTSCQSKGEQPDKQ
jgi:hypothetical protein